MKLSSLRTHFPGYALNANFMIKNKYLRVLVVVVIIAMVMATCLGGTLWGQGSDSLQSDANRLLAIAPLQP